MTSWRNIIIALVVLGIAAYAVNIYHERALVHSKEARMKRIGENRVEIDQGGAPDQKPHGEDTNPEEFDSDFSPLNRNYDTRPYSFMYGPYGEIPEESLDTIRNPGEIEHEGEDTNRHVD